MSGSGERQVLLKGFLINISGNISRILRPAFIFLMTKFYSVEVFAAFSVSLAIVEFLQSLALFGMEDACFKYVPGRIRDREKLHTTIRTVVGFVFITSVGFVIGMYALAPLIQKHYFRSGNIWPALPLMLPLVATVSLSRILLAHTRALKRMEYHVLTLDFLEPINMVLFLVIFYFIPLTHKIGPFIAYPAASAVSLVLATYFFTTKFPVSWGALFEALSFDTRVVRYSLYLGGMNVLAGGLRKIDLLIAGYFLKAKEVGVYALAVEIAYMFGKIRTAFNPILSPVISELHYNGEFEKLGKSYRHSSFLIFLFSTPVLLTFLIYGKNVLFLFGSAYGGAYGALVVLSIAHFISNSLGQAFQVTAIVGKPAYSLGAATFDLVVRSICGFLFIPAWGIMGAALSTSAGTALSKIPLVYYLRKRFRVWPFIKVQWVTLVLAAVLALVIEWSISLLPIELNYVVELIVFLVPFIGIYFFLIYRWTLRHEEDW